MTCKDCIHCGVCDYTYAVLDLDAIEKRCDDFADKFQHIKLPCKVGDTVYFIKSLFSFMSTPKAEKVHRIGITEGEMIFRTETRAFCEKAINDTVFLTKESAEKALRECENK